MLYHVPDLENKVYWWRNQGENHHGDLSQVKSLTDNMKQPTAILPVLYIPVFYQNLPVSAILVQILINTRYKIQDTWFLHQ
jgi:hypothetical protein